MFKDLLFLCQLKAEKFMMIMMIFSWRNLVNFFHVNLLLYKNFFREKVTAKYFAEKIVKQQLQQYFRAYYET